MADFAGLEPTASIMMRPMPLSKRSCVLVDAQFQLHYVKVALLIGVGVVLALTSVVLIPMMAQGIEIDPPVYKMLAGLCIIVILLCTLMGVLSVGLTHRVAGASIRLNRFIEDLATGRLDDEVALRKKDYLQSIADSLNRLCHIMRARCKDVTDLSEKLSTLKDTMVSEGRLSDPEREELDHIIGMLRHTTKSKEPSPSS